MQGLVDAAKKIPWWGYAIGGVIAIGAFLYFRSHGTSTANPNSGYSPSASGISSASLPGTFPTFSFKQNSAGSYAGFNDQSGTQITHWYKSLADAKAQLGL